MSQLLEKKNHYNRLFGFYENLLTEKQVMIFNMYYGDDYSLAEIAEELNISRNAVHDALKLATINLDELEKKLHLNEKNIELNKILDNYQNIPECIPLINEIKEME